MTSLMQAHLDELGVPYEHTSSGALRVDAGSTAVYIKVDDFAGKPVVLLLAPVLCDVEPDPGALIQLLAMNSALNFGKFSWHPQDRQVTIEYELLAEHVDRHELAVALQQVGAVADLYDEPLKALLGGRRPLADDQP